jgi:hypothetical protein
VRRPCVNAVIHDVPYFDWEATNEREVIDPRLQTVRRAF